MKRARRIARVVLMVWDSTPERGTQGRTAWNANRDRRRSVANRAATSKKRCCVIVLCSHRTSWLTTVLRNRPPSGGNVAGAAVEFALLDIGPWHVLGPLAVDEDQHARILLAEVAVRLELQLLAALEGHSGVLGVALRLAGKRDRGHQAEGDGVVHPLGGGVERLGGLALVQVVDQPPGKTAAGPRGEAARERTPRQEVVVGRAAAGGGEVDALEGVPGDQDPAIARIVDVDPAVALADFPRAGERDLPAVEQRHQGAVGRAARDGADGVEAQLELTLGGAAVELVGADALLPVPLNEAGEIPLPRPHRSVKPVGDGAEPGGPGRGGEELDGADPVEVHGAATGVPDTHAVVVGAGLEAAEGEHGPALAGDPHLANARLDARDVAEARHEGAADLVRAVMGADLEPEQLDRPALLGPLLGRHVGEPGVLLLEAVEVVAPERLLVSPKAQPPLVAGAADGGDAAVEEPLNGRRRGSCW